MQILYTQIDRDDQQRPHFREHAYRVNAEAYFYPASTLKLAGALLALEKLDRVPGIDRDTPLRIGSARDAQEGLDYASLQAAERAKAAEALAVLTASLGMCARAHEKFPIWISILVSFQCPTVKTHKN